MNATTSDLGSGRTPLRRRPTPLRRKVGLAAISMIVVVVILEVVLQVGALAVHFATRTPPIDVSGATETILCVGDSWTHGMGCSDATSRSYPAVLQELLRQRTGKPWTVVNGGFSGQNSRDVLLRLPSQLTATKPRFVLVLVGRNDMWSCPDLVGDATTFEDYRSYRFRWRLPRLVAWALDAVQGEASTKVVAPKPRGPEWEARSIPWFVAYPKEPGIVPYRPEVAPLDEAGWRAMRALDYEAAITAFESSLALAESPSTRAALVGAFARAGRMESLEPHVEWLRTKWPQTQNYWVGRELVAALSHVNRYREAKDVAVAFLARWPDEATIRAKLAVAQMQVGELEAALASAVAAQATWKNPMTYMVRRKALVFLHRHESALDACLECYVATNDAKILQDDLLDVLRPDLVPVLRRRLQDLPCDPSVRARMAEVAERCIAALDGASQERILRQHWDRIAGHCRKQGAIPVLLNYPVEPHVGRLVTEFAADRSIDHVDVLAEFTTKVGAERIRALRSADGHVNDEGYRLMAEFVADGLLGLPDWK